ncbi:hypothetical protein PICSAR255_03904 [Mycobacterium avium subsp. paratuberculosis]|nr:hypothetical protein PICSAR255_03904 [Mycobacterium avium subsp. paratuberculosis]
MPYLPVCARPAGCARCYGPGGGAGGVIGIGTVTNGKCRYIVTGGWWGTGGAAGGGAGTGGGAAGAGAAAAGGAGCSTGRGWYCGVGRAGAR